jgi:hypothetical protein
MQVRVGKEEEAARAVDARVDDAQTGERETAGLDRERVDGERDPLGDRGRPDERERSDQATARTSRGSGMPFS